MIDPKANREALEAALAPALLERLASATRSPAIPPAVDEAILRAGREHLEARPGGSAADGRRPMPAESKAASVWSGWQARLQEWLAAPGWLGPRPAAALVAVLLVGAWLVAAIALRLPREPQAGAGQAADVNRDGRVDILDALALALAVEANGPLDLALDLNGDGAVNRRDADWVAARAVSMNGGDPL